MSPGQATLPRGLSPTFSKSAGLSMWRRRTALSGLQPSIKPQPMRSSPVITSLRALTWCSVILLGALTLLPVRAFAALSLLPAIKMVRGVVPAPVGHFVAYAVAAAITMTVYGARRGGMQIIGGFWVYAGVLEYLQHFSPGRHPSIVAFYWLSPWRAVWRAGCPSMPSRLRVDRSMTVGES